MVFFVINLVMAGFCLGSAAADVVFDDVTPHTWWMAGVGALNVLAAVLA